MRTAGSLNARLREGAALTAVFVIIPSTHVVEMIGIAGFDAVIIDMEHGPFSIDSLIPLILAAKARDMYPIVRVRANDPALIGAALDAGAAGLLVPQVTSAAAAAAVVQAARFAPDGARGTNPWVRAANYGAAPGWFAEANRDVSVMVMIEGREGLAALDEIVAVKGLDGIFLGPVDMAQSLGVGGQPEHAKVIEAMRSTIATASARHLATAVFAPTSAAAKRWLGLGVRVIALSEDAVVMMDAFRRLKQDLDQGGFR
jgi:4-hydroxy-2-oxoheptanedioate aldolase